MESNKQHIIHNGSYVSVRQNFKPVHFHPAALKLFMLKILSCNSIFFTENNLNATLDQEDLTLYSKWKRETGRKGKFSTF